MGKRIDELTAYTDPAMEDLLVMVDDPSSTYLTRKVTLQKVSDLISLDMSITDASITNASITNITDTTNVQGDTYYHDGTEVQRLPASTKGKALTTGGVGANPSYEGMTTSGDTEYHNGTTRTRLPKANNGDLYTLSSGIPAWIAPSTPSVFASGTKMLFYQDTAPTGWTIQNTLDNKVVYITKGSVAGGQTGGSVHSTGSWTISGLSGPAHTHTVVITQQTVQAGGGQQVGEYGTFTSSSSGTGSVTSDATWRPAAYCCIICAKD